MNRDHSPRPTHLNSPTPFHEKKLNANATIAGATSKRTSTTSLGLAALARQEAVACGLTWGAGANDNAVVLADRDR